MKIFPVQPKLVRADVEELFPVTGNVRIPLRKFLDTDPDMDTLKKVALIEVHRAKVQPDPMHYLRRGVLKAVLKRIQQKELTEILTNVEREVKP